MILISYSRLHRVTERKCVESGGQTTFVETYGYDSTNGLVNKITRCRKLEKRIAYIGNGESGLVSLIPNKTNQP